MIKVIPAKLTGSPDASGWAQVFEFKPTDEAKFNLRGHLIAVIATSSPKELGINAVLEGREILTRLQEEYFGNETLPAFDCLKSAVTKVTQEFSEEGGVIQIGAMVLMENTLYIGVSGGARAILLRQGALVNLADGSKESSFVSGYVKPLDMLLIGTQKFFVASPGGVIRASLESGDPQACLSELAPMIHARPNNGDFGVVVVKFQDPTTVTIPTPVSQPTFSPAPTTSTLKRKVVNFLDRLINLIPERRLYIHNDTRELGEEKRRSVAIVAGIILILVLGVSVFFGLRQTTIKGIRSKYIDRLTKAQHELQEAKSLASIDKDRARVLLFDSKQIALELTEEGVKDSELDSLNSDISQSMGEIAGIYQANSELYLDLSLLTSGFSGEKISLSDSNMLVLDKNGQRVVSIDTSTKKTEIAAGPDILKNAVAVAAYTDKNYVADDNGISDVTGEEPRLVINKDWNGNIETVAFSGNLYVMEKENSVIWRYQGNAGIFGSKENWFGEGVNPDLSAIQGMSIDGSIWALGQGGKILKFTLGKPDSFNISGVDGSLNGVVALYTNDENENIHLLDRGGSRIIVINKNGAYQAQYLNDQIKDATGIVASEKDGRIIILVGPKLYAIEMKNL